MNTEDLSLNINRSSSSGFLTLFKFLIIYGDLFRTWRPRGCFDTSHTPTHTPTQTHTLTQWQTEGYTNQKVQAERSVSLMLHPTESWKYTALASYLPPLAEIWLGFVKCYTTCVSQPAGPQSVPLLIHRVNANQFSFPAVHLENINFWNILLLRLEMCY